MSESHGGAPPRRRGRPLRPGSSIILLDRVEWISSIGDDDAVDHRPPGCAQPLVPLDDWLKRAADALASAERCANERDDGTEPQPARRFPLIPWELPEDPSRAYILRTPREVREYALRLLSRALREHRAAFEPVDGAPGFMRPREPLQLSPFVDERLADALAQAFPDPRGPAFESWAGYPWTSTRSVLFARPFGSDEMRVEAVELDDGLRLYVSLERDCWCGIRVVALCEGLPPERADAAFREAFRRSAGEVFGVCWPEGDA